MIFDNAIKVLNAEYETLGIEPVIKKFGLNPGWNAVIGSEGCCGVAMSFRNNNPNYHDKETFFDPAELTPFIGTPLFSLVRRYHHDAILKRRSIVSASLNALSQPFVNDAELRRRGYDTIIREPVRQDDIVAIVGYGGLVREYAGRCKELHVTDMRPAEAFKTTIIGEEIEYGPIQVEVHSEKENEEVISGADVVFITGSTLPNGTFDEVIRYAEDARIRCLYGSSAQLLPQALFDSGVNLIMSVAITDPIRFEYDLMNSPDLEGSLKKYQRKYVVSPA